MAILKREEIQTYAEHFLSAWNSQEVERVVACYTNPLVYLDPNTRGAIQSAEAMGRYLTRLFDKWQMHWALKEGFPMQEEKGATILWHATFQKKGHSQIIEVDGMDLVLFEDHLIKRNEVYFDRLALLPLMGMTGRLLHYFMRPKKKGK